MGKIMGSVDAPHIAFQRLPIPAQSGVNPARVMYEIEDPALADFSMRIGGLGQCLGRHHSYRDRDAGPLVSKLPIERPEADGWSGATSMLMLMRPS
ncbi:hypothetical protein OLX02_18795 [Novosphingobium sp. KCTC 2891]|nr:hypothetical protein [Novosphingobium sp. KCTC 2891]